MIDQIPLAKDSNPDQHFYVTVELKFLQTPTIVEVFKKSSHLPGIQYKKDDKVFVDFEVWCKEDLEMVLDAQLCEDRIDFAPATPIGFLEIMFLKTLLTQIEPRQFQIIQRMLRVLKDDGLLAFRQCLTDQDKLYSYKPYIERKTHVAD